MDWTMLGAIGELGGAIVVGLSLVYLGLQVRVTNRMAKAEAWRAALHKFADITTAGVFQAEFRKPFARIYLEDATRDDLSADERVIIGGWLTAQLNVLEQIHREVEVGILPADALESLGDGVFRLPYFRTAWPFLRGNFRQPFQEYMELEYGLAAVPEAATEASA